MRQRQPEKQNNIYKEDTKEKQETAEDASRGLYRKKMAAPIGGRQETAVGKNRRWQTASFLWWVTLFLPSRTHCSAHALTGRQTHTRDLALTVSCPTSGQTAADHSAEIGTSVVAGFKLAMQRILQRQASENISKLLPLEPPGGEQRSPSAAQLAGALWSRGICPLQVYPRSRFRRASARCTGEAAAPPRRLCLWHRRQHSGFCHLMMLIVTTLQVLSTILRKLLKEKDCLRPCVSLSWVSFV